MPDIVKQGRVGEFSFLLVTQNLWVYEVNFFFISIIETTISKIHQKFPEKEYESIQWMKDNTIKRTKARRKEAISAISTVYSETVFSNVVKATGLDRTQLQDLEVPIVLQKSSYKPDIDHLVENCFKQYHPSHAKFSLKPRDHGKSNKTQNKLLRFFQSLILIQSSLLWIYP